MAAAAGIAAVAIGPRLGAENAAKAPTLPLAELDSLLMGALAPWALGPSELGFRTDYEAPDRFRLPIVDRLLLNPRATAATAESLATGFEAAATLSTTVEVAGRALGFPELSLTPDPPTGDGAFHSAGQRLAELERALESHLGRGPHPSGPGEWTTFLANGSAILTLSEADATASLEAVAAAESLSTARTRAALDQARALDRRFLLATGAELAALGEALLRSAADSTVTPTSTPPGSAALSPWNGPLTAEGDVIGVFALPDGRPAVLGGRGPTRYLLACGLILDLGGDDVYLAGAGGNGGEPGRLALAVDLGGDDVYTGPGPMSLAAAGLGAGILIDVAGNDVYRAGDQGLGAAFGGVGVLDDRSGDDRYLASTFSLGAGAFGFGLLRDQGGRDLYQGSAFTEGFGFVAGLGLLDDRLGEDVYLAAPRFSDQLRDASTTLSLAQGFGYGARPDGSGGIGLLVDGAGHDRYLAEVFGQGAAYWCALGALVDRAGNDHYDGFNYVQGSGVHVAVAALVDQAGNDHYRAKGVSQGCGHDLALGMLIEGGGDDRFDASDLAQGAGNANGAGLLLDLAGDDAMTANTAATTQAYSNARRNRGSVGVLMNLGGKNAYSDGRAGEGRLWLGDEIASGFDGEPVVAEAMARLVLHALAVDLRDLPPRDPHSPPSPPSPLIPLEPKPSLPAPEAIPESVRALPFARLYTHAVAGEPRFAPERDLARAELVRRGPAIVSDLANHLGTESATERHAIKDLAVALGPDRVARPFAQVMAGKDERAARAAAWCLERMEASNVEAELLRAARHASWRVRAAAITALARGGGARSLSAIARALGDRAAPVRQAAAHALGERVELGRAAQALASAEERSAMARLVRAVRDPDANVRLTAARALGRGGERATPLLLGELAARAGKIDRTELALVVSALGASGDPGVLPALTELEARARGSGDPLLASQCVLARGRIELRERGAPVPAGRDTAPAMRPLPPGGEISAALGRPEAAAAAALDAAVRAVLDGSTPP
jgi:HEAT repeat protein